MKVGGSVFGKYPPPIEVTEPCRDWAGCDMGDTSPCEGCVYPVGAEGRSGAGGDTGAAEKLGDGCEVSGADSTYDWYGLCGGAPWFIRCTSGSSGSKAGGDAARWVSCTGFVALGSSPALIALRMRRAWYLAYFVFAAISASLFFQTDIISRNVEAARRVSTVCLSKIVSLGTHDPMRERRTH